MGHVHMGTCFPVGQTLSGTVHFDLRVVVHDNLGTLTRVKMQDDKSTDHVVLRPNLEAPNVNEQAWWFPIDIDTTEMPDGMRHFRFYADIEHENGNTMTARPILSANVQNGNADSNAPTRFAGTGWYKEAQPFRDFGYLVAQLSSIPTGPQSGTVSYEVTCRNNGTSDSPEVTSFTAHLDPNIHGGNPGTLLTSEDGAGNYTVEVDTATLDFGMHRILFRCAQTTDDGSETFIENAGILLVPLLVGG